ncbi:hypothetical protein K8O68_09445 [Salipaludibacillus sp. CUR1]|uniref:hypothetical protein n=1 Tax=Salipaludibacillus sp. CUR1 TaxID=2820003 RepID=UPI001E485749|nr:hypothetical protein [Salipaludibacillus sp. CUR1]MCE7792638.1 hypothetical protein [Salipaludibacillus sp. CUR1]
MSNLKHDLARYVKEHCATYAGNGRCHLDRPCVYFTDGDDFERCIYAENCVLPGSDTLWSRYLNIHNQAVNSKACVRCAVIFDPTNNRQKYCKNCAKERRKERQRNYMREVRKRKNNYET